MFERIKPIGFNDGDGIKMLLYGRSGTGKTTLWATFPGPVLAILASGGDKPGELRSVDTPEYRKKIKSVTLQETGELRQLVEYLKDAGSSEYRTVVLDHASGLQDMTLKEILGLSELPAQKTWGMASQQQYGQSTTMCKEYLRALLGLDCNVVIIAQERTFGDSEGSDVVNPTVGAGLTPSLTGWLNQAVDYIAQTFIRQKEEVKESTIGGKTRETRVATNAVEYCLRVGPHAVFQTKFRVPRAGTKMPDVLVDATYDKVMKVIKGS